MPHNVEVNKQSPENKLPVGKTTVSQHRVDRVYGILGDKGSTDVYLEEIRGAVAEIGSKTADPP